MTIFGYGRVSTADHTADNQQLEIERAAYAVEYWFADTVSSRRIRPTQRVWQNARQVRSKDTLLVSKLDRLGRDAPDLLATIKSLASLPVRSLCFNLESLT